LFREVAGDRDPPARPVKELWIIAGRRAGKDSLASAIATAFAMGDYRKYLRPGETASIAIAGKLSNGGTGPFGIPTARGASAARRARAGTRVLTPSVCPSRGALVGTEAGLVLGVREERARPPRPFAGVDSIKLHHPGRHGACQV